jgi:hypothetical protein
MNKMYQKPFEPKPDLHGHLFDGEIDYEGLAELFLCSLPTIRYFVKAKILPVKRKAHKKHAFDKEKAMETLNPYLVNGRLTLATVKRCITL